MFYYLPFISSTNALNIVFKFMSIPNVAENNIIIVPISGVMFHQVGILHTLRLSAMISRNDIISHSARIVSPKINPHFQILFFIFLFLLFYSPDLSVNTKS